MSSSRKKLPQSSPSESLALKSFPSGPPPQVPLVLSERYKRSSKGKMLMNSPHGKKKEKNADEDEEEGDLDTSDAIRSNRQGSLPKPALSNATEKKRKESADVVGVQFDSSAFAATAESKKDNQATNRRISLAAPVRAESTENAKEMAEAAAHVEEIPVEIYKPFPLSQSSSFNPEKLNPRKLSRLNSVTRAKYLAYSLPDSQILEKIVETERRSKKFLIEEHNKISRIIYSAKKRWAVLHHADEGLIEKEILEHGALNAQKRLESKMRRMEETREEELQFLVEGQSSSIDAIRLKEHLVVRKVKLKNQPQFTPKERLKLNELLS